MAGAPVVPSGGAGLRRPPGRILPVAFYARDTIRVARDLLGCLLCRREEDGSYTVGRIVETEAYQGEEDPACHAAAGRTPRTRVLYGPPGRAYVYFTYGMHHCLNVVTEREGMPAAVLLRALRPEGGLRRMTHRRQGRAPRDLTRDPARLCEALAIDLHLNDTSLRGPVLGIRTDGTRPTRIACGPRVGIRVGTDRLWRFWVEGDPFVSRGSRPAPSNGSRRG